MAENIIMEPIGWVESDFSTKFGIPRQSGLVEELVSRLVLAPAYRKEDALRGIEGYSHLWLIWHFSEAEREGWSPTVRPPRLGGNTRMGVFATRSPFRPNAIGLSCVALERVEKDPRLGPVLYLRGADLMDGTPVLDIKPYLPHVDAHPEAAGGFALAAAEHALKVDAPRHLLERVPENKRRALLQVLEQDPRPSYQNDPERVYGFVFAGLEIGFQVDGQQLRVCRVEPVDARKERKEI